jgi:hypothetical protein
VELSTKAETRDVEGCLARENGGRVLIVTSDFHTRRALSIFRRELRQNVLRGGLSRQHAIQRALVDSLPVGEDLLGRMAAAAMVDRCRAVMLSESGAQSGKYRKSRDEFSTGKRVPAPKGY